MKYDVKFTSQFKKDLKLVKKQNCRQYVKRSCAARQVNTSA